MVTIKVLLTVVLSDSKIRWSKFRIAFISVYLLRIIKDLAFKWRSWPFSIECFLKLLVLRC